MMTDKTGQYSGALHCAVTTLRNEGAFFLSHSLSPADRTPASLLLRFLLFLPPR